MKKILALALSLTLALSLCACGGDTTGDTAENTDTQQMETDVVEIPEVEDLTSTDTSTIHAEPLDQCAARDCDHQSEHCIKHGHARPERTRDQHQAAEVDHR